MTDSGNSVPGPQVGTPIEVLARDDAWGRARADLTDRGTALIYARTAGLEARLPAGGVLGKALGRDWSRYLGLAHPDVRRRYAASRELLKRAVGAVLDGDPNSVELVYGPTGRPYLRGHDRVDVSLSLSEDLLLVGLTTRGLIGVDVERADRPLYLRGLDRHLCTPYELVTLTGRPEEERNPALVRLWNLKEAYRKAIGPGRQFDFTAFGFGPDGSPVRVERPDGSAGSAGEWAFRTFVLDSGHYVSAALYDAGSAEGRV
ncbi:4'-phosphopantetheinyl transferase superfamily protein [Kitasatospora sp. NPDC004799]|uniref:4'-phosphopantetheinyl transferase family protein n=1 Tax=Kitasatospora sp. NPDC004799 TaxID=3154460 RepID=UPI0033AAD5C8